jgi:hypothetical protein
MITGIHGSRNLSACIEIIFGDLRWVEAFNNKSNYRDSQPAGSLTMRKLGFEGEEGIK